ncbi:MAG: hypothetical protein WC315_00420 [Candidatus Omnitrophota bacterium]|jgi:hypothetical protein
MEVKNFFDELADLSIEFARDELIRAGVSPGSDDWLVLDSKKELLCNIVKRCYADHVPDSDMHPYPYTDEWLLKLWVTHRKRPENYARKVKKVCL